MIKYNRGRRSTVCYEQKGGVHQTHLGIFQNLFQELLNIGGEHGWCGVCLKNASPGTYGHCTYESPQRETTRELITKVKRAKHWGFCSDLCKKDSRPNTLQETQLTVLSEQDCAGFNSSVLSYRQDGELCAGNKIPYPMMKVYIRKKLRRRIDGRKYTFIPQKDKINTVNTQLIFHNGVKSYLKEHSFYFIAYAHLE